MSRQEALARAEAFLTSGSFRADLARLVAVPTESQNPERAADLERYVECEMRARLEDLGFRCTALAHPKAAAPFLYAERIEDEHRPTILGYGHGDVVSGLPEQWSPGLSPWTLTQVGERWYGRGTADNKGQHAINLAALRAVLETRGSLGFNAKYLIEMGEEVGSPGLRELCIEQRTRLRADVLLASDGPRLQADRPTIFLGSRGAATFDLTIEARSGGHHSGNWGGLLSDPAIQLAHALSSITSPTGQIAIDAWVPREIPPSVRRALATCDLGEDPEGPRVDPSWGEPGLTAAEKVFGWCSFDILAMEAGSPATPVNAVPPRAWARGQLRFVVGIDPDDIVPALRRHLAHRFPMVRVDAVDEISRATRLDPDDPWVQRVASSMATTLGTVPTILPNLGGTLPNDIFSVILGLRTIWVPHSYRGCGQHGPNEHTIVGLVRDGLRLMAGIYWDLGDPRETA
jgi:acetylornithine deacetylase/succinyl-diaminopimelate desuccinylase-like protein